MGLATLRVVVGLSLFVLAAPSAHARPVSRFYTDQAADGPFPSGNPKVCDIPPVYGAPADGVNDLNDVEKLGRRSVAANNAVTGMACGQTCRNPQEFVRVLSTSAYEIRSVCTGFLYTAAVFTTPKGCCDPPMVGNPVSAASGVKLQIEQDYRGTAAGQLSFVRYYNSYGRNDSRNALGPKWKHNYSKFLNPLSLGLTEPVVQLWRPDGDVYTFVYSAGAWQRETTEPGTLLQSGSTWEYRTESNAIERYDHVGRLTSETDAQGRTVTLTYNALKRLESVSDSFGNQISFTFNSNDLIATMTDAAGNLYSYGYDAANNLTQVTYPDNPTRRYHYEQTGINVNALTGITDETSTRIATWAYNASGYATSSQGAGGANAITLSWNSDGTTSVTDAGGTTTYSFQVIQGVVKPVSASGFGCASCGADAASYEYDANGYITKKTDRNGNVTTYVPDSMGRELSRTEAHGTPIARTITTQWHATYRLPVQIDETGRRTTYTYDANGKRLTETTFDTQTLESRTTTWTYTASGQVVTVDGPRTDVSDTTDYDYDARGNLIRITNALGHVTQIPEHDAHGNPLRIVNPNGVVTTLSYDLRQRLKTRTVAGATTRFDYDGVGQLTQVTLPDSSFLSYTYDPAHRLTGIQDNLGNRIHYTLDALGNRTKEEVFDPVNTLRRRQSQIFDTLGRLKEIRNAANQVVTEYGYDAQGNRTSQTDAGSFVTGSAYDPLNRVKKVTDPASGITQYGYNSLDQLVSVTDPKSLTTVYRYNALGDLTQQISPDTGTTGYTYDSAGNRKTETDARGVTATFSHDALNRVTTTDYPGAAEDIGYSYDGTNYSSATPNGIGRLTGISDASGTTMLVYDAHGNVIEERRVIGGAAYVTGYAYDAADRLTGMTYPSGRSVSYERNALGQVSRVTMTQDGSTQVLATDIAYLPFGGIEGYTLGNGVTITRMHDLDYRVEELKDQGSTLIRHQQLFYDLRSNIESILDQVDSARTQVFDYDALSRLTAAEGAYGMQGFGYDAVGNRLSLTMTPPGGSSTTDTYSYGPTSHRLLGISGSRTASYSYDAAGATVSDGTRAFTYGQAHRMASATNAGGQTYQYVVNARGQRAVKRAPGLSGEVGTTVFVHDRGGNLIAEHEQESNEYRYEFIWLEGAPLYVAGIKPGLTGTRPPLTGPDNEQPVATAPATSTVHAPAHDRDGRFVLSWSTPVPFLFWKGKVRDGRNADGDLEYLVEIATDPEFSTPQTLYTGTERRQELLVSGLSPGDYYFRVRARYRIIFQHNDTVWGPAYTGSFRTTVNPDPLNPGQIANLTTQVFEGYFHNTHLNTPQLITGPEQRVVWEAMYLPFGTATLVTAEVPNPLRFPGQYEDQETGLYQNWHRDYDPATDRYLQFDPIGLEGGINGYIYAEANPIRYTDPMGLWVKRCSRKLGDPSKPATNQRFYNLLRHDYLNISGQIRSFQAGDNMAWSQGRIDRNEDQEKGCQMVCDDDKFDKYVLDAVNEIGAPTYCVIAYPGSIYHALGARNCQTWANDVLNKAKEKYLKDEKCPKCFK